VGSSPYSTGGGGVRLEQEFAASVLVSLLLSSPVEGLGDAFTPVSVGLQQERHAPVDDVVVLGRAPGMERTLRMACRRKPVIGKSDESTVKLFADYVQMVLENAAELKAGTLRLGLAVAGPYGPADEVANLADVARRQDSRSEFEFAVAAPGAYSTAVRGRLTLVDDLVQAALEHLDTPASNVADHKEVAWLLLRSLFVLQTQFEGDAAPSRTNLVARLQTVTGSAAQAEALRVRLVEIVAETAIRAGALTRAMLRKELRPFGILGASPDFVLARAQVELLETELRQQTRHSLPRPAPEDAFVLGRSEKEEALAGVISRASPGHVVIVRGEPDVGKSALALAAVDRIRASGGAALAMSLRDLPATGVEIRNTLGLAPAELLSAAPSAPVSALLLDGAEVVQEGSSGALSTLLTAAGEAGVTPVLVVRNDAGGSLVELISSRANVSPIEFVVDPLTNAEIKSVVDAIPELARLAEDARAVWLLRRLGLVELLLRAAASGSPLPRSLSSEAEVFATVWSALVRRNERMVGTVSPDDRDAALRGVARRLLTGTPGGGVPGAALATLRADGLLLSLDRKAAWQSTDRFASDVLRDFATARLLLGEGIDLLVRSSAPRWAIRAARIYAQACLSEVAEDREEQLRARWVSVRSEFAALADAHGPRWAEVPWEALLSAGWAPQALDALSTELLEKPSLQDELMRCVSLRFASDGMVDPMVAAPGVRWFVETARLFGTPRSYREDPVGEFVRSWLSAVALDELKGRDVAVYGPLRRRVRDELLAHAADVSEEWLESLALLGSDSDPASDDALRAPAKTDSDRLGGVVEAPIAAALLAKRDAALLAELAEAYYIEPEENPFGWGGTLMDEGIRSHGPSGLLGRQAASYRGPFLSLLRADPNRGLAVVERMLRRAARDRTQILGDLDSRAGRRPTEMGVRMSLLGSESRLYVGDAHVWYWYRGSAVGPYPCVSALLALETVIDEWVRFGVPLRKIAIWLVESAQTLATPGLLFGFLVRHIEKVTDELDDFLAVPEMWELEFTRNVHEGMLHVQGPDAEDLHGRERRKWLPYDVAGQLVTTAASRGDEAGLERLRGVSRRLLEASGEDPRPDQRQWAAALDWDSYEVQPHESGYMVSLQPPAEVAEALAPVQAESRLTMQMYTLMNRYRLRALTPYRSAPAALPDESVLSSDVESANELANHLADEPLDHVRLSIAGLAASVVHGAATGTPVDPELLSGAVELLINSVTQPYLGEFPIDRSIYPDGADRKAALALPAALLLMVRSAQEGGPSLGEVSQGELEEALRASAASLFLEVRWNAAEGMRMLLEHPCGRLPDRSCWHEVVWRTIEAASRSTVLGEFVNMRRSVVSLEGDLVDALTARPDADLMLTHIAPAAAVALDAAAAPSCI